MKNKGKEHINQDSQNPKEAGMLHMHEKKSLDKAQSVSLNSDKKNKPI